MSIIVLISGNGTNLQAIIDVHIPITEVISNRSKAGGLVRAEKHGIPTSIHPWNRKEARVLYDLRLAQYINGLQADLVVLAGWMHIFTKEFLKTLNKPIINLHPALPDTFKGADAIGMAWEAYQKGLCKETGAMVHYVVPEIDSGEVIATEKVEIEDGDTLEMLRVKVQKIEKPLLIRAIKHILHFL